MPQTVGLTAEGVIVLEQNFEYDLVDESKLYHKYLEQPITLNLDNDTLFQGRLLSVGRGSDKGIVLEQESGDIVSINKRNVVTAVFPELPAGLITRPTLKWLVSVKRSDTYPITLTYQTSGISWEADYVAILNQDDTAMQLGCWVTVRNRTGTCFADAQLKLIAGDIFLATDSKRSRYQTDMVSTVASVETGFTERSFFEYHLYTLDRPATLKNNQDKQLALFPTRDVAVEREYLFDHSRDPNQVLVSVRFENDRASKLGIPLPAGVVRVYKLDEDDTRQLVGEDRIEHTPKDEPVSLTLGKVFDMAGERTVLDYEQVGRYGHRATIEVELRNHKEEAATVKVHEHLPAGAEITACNVDYERPTATLLELELEVPTDGEASLEYSYKLKRHGVIHR